MATNEVIVLDAGYSKWKNPENKSIMLASCSSTLVESKETGMKILVDTFGPWEQGKLHAALRANLTTPDDIQWLVGTHGHPDHIGNLNLFNLAKHVVGFSVYYSDEYQIHPFECGEPLKITDTISIIPTPGHTASDVSVIIKNASGECPTTGPLYGLGGTPGGEIGTKKFTGATVAIVGDLFECEADLDNEKIWLDAGSENPELQRSNREKVLQIADYIVPGHGPMFEVPKKQ